MINMSYCEMAQFIELCCVLLTGMWKTECTVSQVTSFGNIARKLLARYPVGAATCIFCSYRTCLTTVWQIAWLLPEPGFPNSKIGCCQFM